MRGIFFIAGYIFMLQSFPSFTRVIEEQGLFFSSELKDEICPSDEINSMALCPDIDTLFAMIGGSFQDSQFGPVNDLLIPYKKNLCDLRLLISSRRTINGVANTTPLHLAVQGDNLGISAIIFQKISVLGPDFQDFSRSLANAYDGNGLRPIDYTTDPDFISFLDTFTAPY